MQLNNHIARQLFCQINSKLIAAKTPRIKMASSGLYSLAIRSTHYIAPWNIDVSTYFQSLTNPITEKYLHKAGIVRLSTHPAIFPDRAEHHEEFAMLNLGVTFFLCAVVAAVFGFGGLAGTFTEIAKFIAVIFVVLFVASLVYGAISGRRPDMPSL